MHPGRSAFLALAAFTLWPAISASASGRVAQRANAFSLTYRSADGCPSESGFDAEIAARTARAVKAPAGPDVPAFVVELRSDGDAWTGTVRVRQPDGTASVRAVRAPSCAEVGAALALVVALTLDPQASLQRETNARPSEPAARQPAPRAHAEPPLTAPISSSAEAPPLLAPTSLGRPRPEKKPAAHRGIHRPSLSAARVAEPAVETPAEAPVPKVEQEAPKVEPTEPQSLPLPQSGSLTSSSNPSRSISNWSWIAGLGARAHATTPWWIAGGDLFASASHVSGWQLGLSVSAFPASHGVIHGARASFGLLSARGEGCHTGIQGDRVRLVGCAAFDVGRLSVSGEPGGPIVEGLSDAVLWLATAAIGRVEIPVEPWVFGGQGELIVPITRDSFGVQTGSQFSNSYRPPALAVGVRLFAGYRFY